MGNTTNTRICSDCGKTEVKTAPGDDCPECDRCYVTLCHECLPKHVCSIERKESNYEWLRDYDG